MRCEKWWIRNPFWEIKVESSRPIDQLHTKCKHQNVSGDNAQFKARIKLSDHARSIRGNILTRKNSVGWSIGARTTHPRLRSELRFLNLHAIFLFFFFKYKIFLEVWSIVKSIWFCCFWYYTDKSSILYDHFSIIFHIFFSKF